MQPTAVALLVRWRPDALLWGSLRLPLGSLGQWLGARRPTGLQFQKFLGSGRGGGFQIWPSLDHQGWFGVFGQPDQAEEFIQTSALVRSYRQHSAEHLVLQLQAYASRGRWSNQAIEPSSEGPGAGPIVSLTRASIRVSRARAFWAQSPDAERDLALAPGCELAVGLGEMPLLRQATLSLWRDEASLMGYARSGAHLRAIEAAYRQGFFTESLFTRFVVRSASGHWRGRVYG